MQTSSLVERASSVPAEAPAASRSSSSSGGEPSGRRVEASTSGVVKGGGEDDVPVAVASGRPAPVHAAVSSAQARVPARRPRWAHERRRGTRRIRSSPRLSLARFTLPTGPIRTCPTTRCCRSIKEDSRHPARQPRARQRTPCRSQAFRKKKGRVTPARRPAPNFLWSMSLSAGTRHGSGGRYGPRKGKGHGRPCRHWQPARRP